MNFSVIVFRARTETLSFANLLGSYRVPFQIQMQQMRTYFFYLYFLEALVQFGDETRLETYLLICRYSFLFSVVENIIILR